MATPVDGAPTDPAAEPPVDPQYAEKYDDEAAGAYKEGGPEAFLGASSGEEGDIRGFGSGEEEGDEENYEQIRNMMENPVISLSSRR